MMCAAIRRMFAKNKNCSLSEILTICDFDRENYFHCLFAWGKAMEVWLKVCPLSSIPPRDGLN